MEIDEFVNPIAGANDIFLDADKGLVCLSVLHTFFVRHVTGFFEVTILQYKGKAFGILLVRLDSAHLRLGGQVGRDDDTIDPITGKLVAQSESFEPRFVNEVDEALREVIPQIPTQPPDILLPLRSDGLPSSPNGPPASKPSSNPRVPQKSLYF